MISLLGMACVAWTIYELVRLLRATAAATKSTPLRSAAARSESDARHAPAASASPGSLDSDASGHAADASATKIGRRPRGRFAAWDDRGRPIMVEDLGAR